MYFFVYFKWKKELNYDRFVDLNILGASRLVHSDLRIYRISFFLLDLALVLRGDKTFIKTSSDASFSAMMSHDFASCRTLKWT